MAVKYSCDKCGADESVEQIELPLKKKVDLCRSCIRLLEAWVKTPLEKEL